jgi:flagellar basal body rod protein FlgC
MISTDLLLSQQIERVHATLIEEVMGSNVELFRELIDMQAIERNFDANLTAMRTYRSMLQNSITNLRG